MSSSQNNQYNIHSTFEKEAECKMNDIFSQKFPFIQRVQKDWIIEKLIEDKKVLQVDIRSDEDFAQTKNLINEYIGLYNTSRNNHAYGV